MGRDCIDRRRFLQATGAASTLSLAGYVGTQGRTTIRYVTDRGETREVLNAIVSEFESQNSDYEVEITFTAKGLSTDQQMQQMVAAGNPPDLFFDTSTDAFRFQQNGVLAPVTEAVQNNDLPDPVNVGGESFFAAAIVEPLMGWYRNDLYPENPNTWSNWLAEAERVTNEEDINGYIVQSGNTNNAETQMTQYLWQNDVDIYAGPSDAIEVTVDQGQNRQRAVETFEWVQQMSQYSPNGNGWEWGDAIAALQQENAAAGVSVGGLPILTIMANRPDLVEKLSPMPYPVPEGKAQDKWWSYMEGHLVRNDGNATQGAREFVNFFNSSERFFDFILSAPLFQFPPTREQQDAQPMQENETLNRFPEVLQMVKDNWDAFTSPLATGDEGAPNLTAADAYGNQVFGQAAEQLLVAGLSPEETVDWLGQRLRSLQE